MAVNRPPSGPSLGSGLGFQLLGFPVFVQPWFLLTAWFIGPQTGDVIRDGGWIVMVFIGILVHELGHATAIRHRGMEPVIVLHGFGGVTSWQSYQRVSPWQQIGISIAGPASGITLGLIALGLMRIDVMPNVWLVRDLIWINLGWGLLNLLPILPLDGGTILSTLAEMVFGRRGRIAALGLSVVLTVAVGVFGAFSRSLWLVIIGVLLTVMNGRALQSELGLRR
jgi:Zn-dependent protease